MAQVYPKHIYEPIRIKIATDYVKGELRKYLPGLRDNNLWEKIDSDIDKWFEKMGPRDFWNGFHGIAMGFKLKHHLTHVLTAENIKWKYEKKLPLNEHLASGAGFGYISDQLAKKATARKVKRYFQNEAQPYWLCLLFFDKPWSTRTSTRLNMSRTEPSR